MRRLTTLTFAVVMASASIGCTTDTNTNINKAVTNANTNSNLAVVVNNNSNAVNNANKPANITREEYDKDRAKYEANKGKDTIGTGASDSWIWFKTKAALTATDASLRDSTINVDVANGVITLKGTVANADQKELAEKTAKGIEGQTGVKNELKVQANDSLTNQVVNGNTSGNSTEKKPANANK